MTGHPRRSGFCGLGNPPDSHDRCRLEGCTCDCHTVAEAWFDTLAVVDDQPTRVRVCLPCLNGVHDGCRYGAECGCPTEHVDVWVDVPAQAVEQVPADPFAVIGSDMLAKLEADQVAAEARMIGLADRPTPAGGTITYTYAAGVDPAVDVWDQVAAELSGGRRTVLEQARKRADVDTALGSDDPLELTATERAAIVHVMSGYDVDAAYAVVVGIVRDRLNPTEGAP